LRVFENRVLWRIFGPEREEVAESWEGLLRSFITCTLYQILLVKEDEMCGTYSTHGRYLEVHAKFCRKT
jgi:hypothetical protein